MQKKPQGQKEDSAHKMALQFQFKVQSKKRVTAVLNFGKEKKYQWKHVGEFAVFTFLPEPDASSAIHAWYKEFLLSHSQCTRVYNVMTVPGLVNVEHGVYMETPRSMESSSLEKEMTMLDVFQHLSIKSLDGTKHWVIQCCFPTKGGCITYGTQA